MKKFYYLLLYFWLSTSVFAQFDTPTINSDLGNNEYGTGNGNSIVSGATTWYVTWDDTYLYVNIQNANETEGAFVYVDVDPISPVNGGSNSDGNLTGLSGYGGLTPDLPFRADAVFYFLNSYRELRRADGTGNWTIVSSGNGGLGGGSDDYSDGHYSSNNRGNGPDSDDDRELRISWSRLTNGGSRPESFNWTGYISYTNGIYGQVPTLNPSGGFSNGDTPDFIRYFTVSSTADNSSTNPTSQESYTHIGGNVSSFGAISVFDFTMNTNGATITRATSADTWTITNDFIVNDGTVSFGASSGVADVSGDVKIGASGTLTLSSAIGGDLSVAGDWTNSGTFNCSDRAVTFDGSSSQSITGATTFDYLTINNNSGVSLSNSITVDNRLQFDNGQISLGSNNLTMNSGAVFNSNTSSKYVVTNGTGVLTRNSVGASDVLFPVGYDASNYNPVVVNNAGTSDNISVKVKSTFTNAPNDASKVVNAAWDITEATPGGSDITLTLQWSQSQEAGSFNRNTGLHIGRYTGTEWVGQNASLVGSDPYTASASGFNSFSEFGVGSEGALPVELTSFTANVFDNKVKLQWETATEVDNYGFEIQRSAFSNQRSANWEKIGFVEGHGNSNSPKNYEFTDSELPNCDAVSYRLKQIDIDGAYEYSNVIEVTVETIPAKFELAQNYPNPFNPTTKIKFSLPEGMAQYAVSLRVYDLIGREVAVLVNENLTAGSYEKTFDASGLSSGIYYYQLTTPEFSSVKKMMLIR